jgi:hypothetical protein
MSPQTLRQFPHPLLSTMKAYIEVFRPKSTPETFLHHGHFPKPFSMPKNPKGNLDKQQRIMLGGCLELWAPETLLNSQRIPKFLGYPQTWGFRDIFCSSI